MSELDRKRCFFEITINNVDAGRITIELFNDIAPKTCENFRQVSFSLKEKSKCGKM